jgi:uncharacterized protein
MTGRVVHFELPFDDKARAMGFYAEVFGWDLEEMPDLDYVGVMTGSVGADGRPTEPGFIGGGMTSRGGVNSGPVVTVDTDDIDATLARVTERGGQVLQERAAVGDMGFTAYFSDTEGNVVGLWQTAQPG